MQSQVAVIRTELEAMFDTDQKGRLELEEVRKHHPPFSPEEVEIWKRQNAIDQQNQQRLIQIVQQHGWPKKSLVGEIAATSAFLILQHSDLKLQQEFLPIFRKIAESGEADLRHLALLEDRVLVGEGKKQLYGTQLRTQKGVKGIQILPIEDEINVDARRAKMGLGPLAEYLKEFGINYEKPVPPSPNHSMHRTSPLRGAAGDFES